MLFGQERLAQAKHDGRTCPYCHADAIVNATNYYGHGIRAVKCAQCGWMSDAPIIIKKSMQDIIAEEMKESTQKPKCPACGSTAFHPVRSKSGVCGKCGDRIRHFVAGDVKSVSIPLCLVKGKLRVEYELKLAARGI